MERRVPHFSFDLSITSSSSYFTRTSNSVIIPIQWCFPDSLVSTLANSVRTSDKYIYSSWKFNSPCLLFSLLNPNRMRNGSHSQGEKRFFQKYRQQVTNVPAILSSSRSSCASCEQHTLHNTDRGGHGSRFTKKVTGKHGARFTSSIQCNDTEGSDVVRSKPEDGEATKREMSLTWRAKKYKMSDSVWLKAGTVVAAVDADVLLSFAFRPSSSFRLLLFSWNCTFIYSLSFSSFLPIWKAKLCDISIQRVRNDFHVSAFRPYSDADADCSTADAVKGRGSYFRLDGLESLQDSQKGKGMITRSQPT